MDWKDLSIRDRAAIIRQSVSDGIYNLGEIRNRFDEGGEKYTGKSEVGMPSDAVQIDDSFAKDFYNQWYNSIRRDTVGLNSFYNQAVSDYNKNYNVDNDKSYTYVKGDKEFVHRTFDDGHEEDFEVLPVIKAPNGDINHTGKIIDDGHGNRIPNPFYRKDILSSAERALSEFSNVENLNATNSFYTEDNSFIGSGNYGAYRRPYGNNVFIRPRYDIDTQKAGVVHEGTHRLLMRDGVSGDNRFLAEQFIPFNVNANGWNDIEDIYYFDNKDEIAARLNQLRYLAGISPQKVFTLDDIKQLKSKINIDYPSGELNGYLINKNFLNRYSDEDLLKLLNNTYAKGGKKDDIVVEHAENIPIDESELIEPAIVVAEKPKQKIVKNKTKKTVKQFSLPSAISPTGQVGYSPTVQPIDIRANKINNQIKIQDSIIDDAIRDSEYGLVDEGSALEDIRNAYRDREFLQYLNNRRIAAFGGDKDTINHPKYNAKQVNPMYDYLIENGLTHEQASGLLGNLAVESYLNADIKQVKGPAYGLMQAEGARKKAMLAYDEVPYSFGSGLTPEEQQQLDYIINKGIKEYTKGEWGRSGFGGSRQARKAFLNVDNTRRASDIITNNFLRPGKPNLNRRRAMSDYYYENQSQRLPYQIENWSEKLNSWEQ